MQLFISLSVMIVLAAAETSLWNYTLPSTAELNGWVAGNSAFVALSSSESLTVLSAETGDVLWTNTAKYSPPAFTPRNDIIVAATIQSMNAFDAKSGTRMWSKNMVLPRTDIAPVITADGTVIVYFTNSGYGCGMNITDGRPLWINPSLLCKSTLARITAAPSGDTVFVSCVDNGFFAVAGRTGNILWNATSFVAVYHSVVVDRKVLVLSSTSSSPPLNCNLAALDVDTGSSLWVSYLDHHSWTSPAQGLKGQVFAVTSYEIASFNTSSLLAVRIKDGFVVSQNAIPLSSNAIVAYDGITVLGSNGTVAAYQGGDCIWSMSTPTQGMVSQQPIVLNTQRTRVLWADTYGSLGVIQLP